MDFPFPPTTRNSSASPRAYSRTLDPRRTLAPDVGALLRDIVQGGDHLHPSVAYLRLSVGRIPGAEPIDAAALQSARDQDIESHLSRIEYRGRTITLAEFYRWQSQFPPALHPVTIDIVRLIAERYYLSTRHHWESLDRLLAEAGLTSIRRVVFCLWQPLREKQPGDHARRENPPKAVGGATPRSDPPTGLLAAAYTDTIAGFHLCGRFYRHR